MPSSRTAPKKTRKPRAKKQLKKSIEDLEQKTRKVEKELEESAPGTVVDLPPDDVSHYLERTEPFAGTEKPTSIKYVYDAAVPYIEQYNILEMSRSIFESGGEEFVKPDTALGEVDRNKLKIFKQYLERGFKIKSIAIYGNNYVFLFEK